MDTDVFENCMFMRQRSLFTLARATYLCTYAADLVINHFCLFLNIYTISTFR